MKEYTEGDEGKEVVHAIKHKKFGAAGRVIGPTGVIRYAARILIFCSLLMACEAVMASQPSATPREDGPRPEPLAADDQVAVIVDVPNVSHFAESSSGRLSTELPITARNVFTSPTLDGNGGGGDATMAPHHPQLPRTAGVPGKSQSPELLLENVKKDGNNVYLSANVQESITQPPPSSHTGSDDGWKNHVNIDKNLPPQDSKSNIGIRSGGERKPASRAESISEAIIIRSEEAGNGGTPTLTTLNPVTTTYSNANGLSTQPPPQGEEGVSPRNNTDSLGSKTKSHDTKEFKHSSRVNNGGASHTIKEVGKDIRINNNNHPSQSDNKDKPSATINGPVDSSGSANNGSANKSVDGSRVGPGGRLLDGTEEKANNNYVDNGKSYPAPQEQSQYYFTPPTMTASPSTQAATAVYNPTAPQGTDWTQVPTNEGLSLSARQTTSPSHVMGHSLKGSTSNVATGALRTETDNNKNGIESDPRLSSSSGESNPSSPPLPLSTIKTISTHLESDVEDETDGKETDHGNLRNRSIAPEVARKTKGSDTISNTEPEGSDRQMVNIRLHAPPTTPTTATKGPRAEETTTSAIVGDKSTTGGESVEAVNKLSTDDVDADLEDGKCGKPRTVVSAVGQQESIQHAGQRANTSMRNPVTNKRSGSANRMNNSFGSTATTARDIVHTSPQPQLQAAAGTVPLIRQGFTQATDAKPQTTNPVGGIEPIPATTHKTNHSAVSSLPHQVHPTQQKTTATAVVRQTTELPLGLMEQQTLEPPQEPQDGEKVPARTTQSPSSAEEWLTINENQNLHEQTITTTMSVRSSPTTRTTPPRTTESTTPTATSVSGDTLLVIPSLTGGSDEHVKFENFAKTPEPLLHGDHDHYFLGTQPTTTMPEIVVITPAARDSVSVEFSLPKVPLRSASGPVGDFVNVGSELNGRVGVSVVNGSGARVEVSEDWPVKHAAIVEGDLILGGLMMVHEREDSVTCGPIMPQGGVQALEAMLYTLDKINRLGLLPNITLGAHILDDCDKDTYGLEMAVDFIKGESLVIIGFVWFCRRHFVDRLMVFVERSDRKGSYGQPLRALLPEETIGITVLMGIISGYS